MDINTVVREKVIAVLETSREVVNFNDVSYIQYNGINIPIFDEFVNPNIPIPEVNKAATYIIIQDQQSSDSAVQHTCAVRLTANLTIKVVTKWGTIGFKNVCENIGSLIDSKLRDLRSNSKLSDVQEVKLSISRTQTEKTLSNIAFSKINIYSITINI
jgi:hypothetical protein